jgi:hypothetical protein
MSSIVDPGQYLLFNEVLMPRETLGFVAAFGRIFMEHHA